MVENKPQKRQMRYSDKELKLIKSTFAERDDILIALRKFIYQQELTEKEEVILRESINGEVADLIYKVFIPELDGNSTFTNLTDIYAVNTKDRKIEDISLEIDINILRFNYLKQEIRGLKDLTHGDIKLEDLVSLDVRKEDKCINFGARAGILNHIEGYLNAIRVIAGEKTETFEEMMKRMIQNSSK